MFANFIVTLLIVSASILYVAHHVKRLRAVEKRTRYTHALYTTYILAAIMMWILPLLYSLVSLDAITYEEAINFRWLIGGIALVILLSASVLYVLDKREQRSQS